MVRWIWATKGREEWARKRKGVRPQVKTVESG